MPAPQAIAEPQGPYVPAFPVIMGQDDIDAPAPLQYAEPVHTNWASPDPVAGPNGAPIDSFPGLANNPNIPGPWNRTTEQGAPGVDYNHNSYDPVMLTGTGSMEMITEPENNMGGLITLFPDARYSSRPLYEDEGNEQWVVWSEPLPSTGKEPGLLTQWVLPI